MENNNDYAKYWYDERERCEQLSKQLDQLKAQLLDQEAETLKAGGIIETLTKENEKLKIYKSITPLSVKKLVKALGEIKEIVENGKRFAERYMITGEQKANVLTYANAILQKISEVEDEKTQRF